MDVREPCKSCDDKEGYGPFIDPDVRCDPARLNATSPAWQSGGLDDLFTRWATDDWYKAYGPRAISSPGGAYCPERGGPWVLVFDDFVAGYEIEQLLKGASCSNVSIVGAIEVGRSVGRNVGREMVGDVDGLEDGGCDVGHDDTVGGGLGA